MDESVEKKAELRLFYKERRAAISADERAEAEEEILRRVSMLVHFRAARLYLFYMPVRGEVNVLPLLERVLRAGAAVALPRCEKEPGEMTFRLVRSVSELTPGAFGVPEPPEDAPAVSEEALKDERACALVPGLAFDGQGFRLGYGKGYYDRFLSAFRGFSVGVCFERQVTDRLPRGERDRRVSAVVSERGVRLSDA